MSTLSKIDPNITFRDLETLICNTSDMADALNAVVWDHFAKKAPDAGYVLTPEEGSRIFFLAGMALEMSRKAYDAYLIAHENEAACRKPAIARAS